MKFMKLKQLIIFFALPLFLAGCGAPTESVQVKITAPESATSTEITTETGRETDDAGNGEETGRQTEDVPANQETAVEIPAELELPVVFASQAPLANWDDLHQEACEEASMIMAARYFAGEALSQTIMEEEIQKLVAWEGDNGYDVDLTAEEAVMVLKDYFGQTARVETEATVDRIKYELSLGNLIIVPAAGRELGNPYFRTPGPIYHMLVIKGYDRDEFITNDVGTRRGDGFKYKYDQLLSAVHDWRPDLAPDGMTEEEMSQGRKVLIVVERP